MQNRLEEVHIMNNYEDDNRIQINALLEEIKAELAHARGKFPGDNVTMLALMEEVGELAKATFEEPRANVRKEAVQVAVMAMRVVLDGDATITQWRADKGLDALI
tara:strand:+ start:243303 stop:243617 length:315 start_codon:yes stop_codon:yes gene_type:complete